MNVEDLIRELSGLSRQQYEYCSGCGREHNCAEYGCQIIWRAICELSKFRGGLETVRERYKAARGVEKAILGDVLDAFQCPVPDSRKKRLNSGELQKLNEAVQLSGAELTAITFDSCGNFVASFARKGRG